VQFAPAHEHVEPLLPRQPGQQIPLGAIALAADGIHLVIAPDLGGGRGDHRRQAVFGGQEPGDLRGGQVRVLLRGLGVDHPPGEVAAGNGEGPGVERDILHRVHPAVEEAFQIVRGEVRRIGRKTGEDLHVDLVLIAPPLQPIARRHGRERQRRMKGVGLIEAVLVAPERFQRQALPARLEQRPRPTRRCALHLLRRRQRQRRDARCTRHRATLCRESARTGAPENKKGRRSDPIIPDAQRRT